MVSQIELLLNYSNRFYTRQFITRQKASSELLIKLEDLLTEYLDNQNESPTGLPTVKYVADKLNVSPNYLSDMLRILTGQSTQQHIHDKVSYSKQKPTFRRWNFGGVLIETIPQKNAVTTEDLQKLTIWGQIEKNEHFFVLMTFAAYSE